MRENYELIIDLWLFFSYNLADFFQSPTGFLDRCPQGEIRKESRLFAGVYDGRLERCAGWCARFPMRIAQVAPLLESVPPHRYGGTERIVSYLTEALVRGNHDVTLFASYDSQTSARLIPCVPRSLGVGWYSPRAHVCHKRMYERVQNMHERFDLPPEKWTPV